MRPASRLAARLIGLLLLLQWGGAVLPQARAMAALGSSMAVEICSPSGMKRMLIGEDGQPVPPMAEDCCAHCLGPMAIEAALPALAAQPPSLLLPAASPARPGLPPLPPRAPPQQPRAPPHP